MINNQFSTKLKSFKSALNHYLGLEVPIWMQSRKSLLIFFFIDFLLFIFTKNPKIELFNDFGLLSNTILYSLLWCLIGYVYGKYSYFNDIKKTYKKLYNLLFSSVIVLTLIFIIDKLLLIFFSDLIPIGRDKIITLGVLSYFLQSIKFFIYKKKNQSNKFYIVGNNQQIDSFINFITKINLKNVFELINLSQDNLDKLENQSIIIFSKENNDENLSYIYKNYLNLKLKLYTPFNWCEKYLHRIPIKYIGEKGYETHQWFINSDSFKWRIKRFGDLFISLILIIISTPLIVLAAFLIFLEDNGPIFYSQIRTGLNGKAFKITKLRTMKVKSELNGPVWASKNDHRVTKIGGILRKSRIDELPQLISVLIGDMSLIGPRPERPSIEILLKEKINYYELRQVIKPGLSGWAQVNYPYGASLEDSENKLSFELFYIRNYSIWLDLLIFIKTIKLVFNMKGADPVNK